MSLREAFISLIPYFVVSAVSILVQHTLIGLGFIDAQSEAARFLAFGSQVIIQFLPAATVIAVGYFLSKNIGLDSIVASFLALTCFAVHGHYFSWSEAGLILQPSASAAYTLLIPTISCYGLHYTMKLCRPLLSVMPGVSYFLRKHLVLIIPFAIVFFGLFFLIPLIEAIAAVTIYPLLNQFENVSVALNTFNRMLVTHVLWFFGIHGDNAFNISFQQHFLYQDILPGLSAKVFYDTFVIFGGSGAIWGLMIAVYLAKAQSHERTIVKIATPFAIFNFSEIIIFALPIVLNPIYLIPFIMAPVCNFIISYYVLGAGLVPFSSTEVSWITPVFINGWIVGDSIITALYQLTLIMLNALIYYPFVNHSIKKRNLVSSVNKLQKSLDIYENAEFENESQFIRTQQATRESEDELLKILNEIADGNLQLHYQPQICVKKGNIIGFEALLRLRRLDGKLVGPYFLDMLIEHKLGYIIDNWVIEQADRDLQEWAKQGFNPVVSINLNPDVLTNNESVDNLCRTFSNYPNQVKVEIVESSYLAQTEVVTQNIQKLKNSGIETVLDDFGTGYSSLSMLGSLPVRYAKLDRSILLSCNTEKGKTLYRHIAGLFQELGFIVVAEGVETQEELEWVRSLQIDYVQGWYYSGAIPPDELVDYVNQWQIKSA
ncbi:PTS sugar transporter subunit IIC/EAL domain-containing protein [Catenovulum sp. SM1970]|uniref:EAL domain-containing protein n=1 Tax=Marinifaba aquimaris TaxID=2741323 RepID=UPI0015726E99|nr:EAL domain-containing protein [Marinifaba aquimaris]NTS78552.1 PTS sugar transporter subunit IIC/EAL domain-containing protein [Marinifaba aquimaris]